MFRLRAFFAAFLLLRLASAQTALVETVELSYRHQPKQDTLYLEALFSFQEAAPRQVVQLVLLQAQVQKIQWVQGLPKGDVPFTYQQNRLQFQLPAQYESRTQIRVHYAFAKNQLESSPFYSPLENGFALNALSFAEDENYGQPGFFYPVPSGQEPKVHLNLLLPKGTHFKAPGELEFSVRTPGGTAYFTRMQTGLKADGFYLIIGDFDPGEDAEDLEETYAFSQNSLRN